MELKAFKKAFIIMITAATMVATYPLLHQQVPVLDNHLKTYAIFPDVLDFQFQIDSNLTGTPSLATLPDSVGQDSLELAYAEVPRTKDNIDGTIAPVVGDYQGVNHLFPFFKELHERNGQIRIAYYGDSSIEGDLICMSFRDSLQRRYGGRGVGFVPLTSIHPGFRRSIHQAASDNWSRNMVGYKNSRRLIRGISGEFFTAKYAPSLPDTITVDSMPPPLDANYWASFKASKWFARTTTFERTRFFYGRPKLDSNQVQMGSISVKANQIRKSFTLRPAAQINELLLLDTTTQRVRIDLQVPSNFPLYGLSLESEAGIIVDNFPLRGSDGYSLKGIPGSVLTSFQEKLDYDLIIFQFGLNVLNPRLKDYSWYQEKIEKLIDHYQEAMPGVPILVLGISDKGTKIGGRMQTDPSVPRITAAQRAAAETKGVAFFSLYEAMGGEGTMIDWVEKQRPKLANPDYTHFNFKGADKMSDLLLEFIMNHYMDYVVNHAEEL